MGPSGLFSVKKISAASLLEIISLSENSKPKDDNWDNFLNELLLAPLVTTKRVMPLFLALSNVEIIPGTNSGPTLMTPNASNNKASK